MRDVVSSAVDIREASEEEVREAFQENDASLASYNDENIGNTDDDHQQIEQDEYHYQQQQHQQQDQQDQQQHEFYQYNQPLMQDRFHNDFQQQQQQNGFMMNDASANQDRFDDIDVNESTGSPKEFEVLHPEMSTIPFDNASSTPFMLNTPTSIAANNFQSQIIQAFHPPAQTTAVTAASLFNAPSTSSLFSESTIPTLPKNENKNESIESVIANLHQKDANEIDTQLHSKWREWKSNPNKGKNTMNLSNEINQKLLNAINENDHQDLDELDKAAIEAFNKITVPSEFNTVSFDDADVIEQPKQDIVALYDPDEDLKSIKESIISNTSDSIASQQHIGSVIEANENQPINQESQKVEEQVKAIQIPDNNNLNKLFQDNETSKASGKVTADQLFNKNTHKQYVPRAVKVEQPFPAVPQINIQPVPHVQSQPKQIVDTTGVNDSAMSELDKKIQQAEENRKKQELDALWLIQVMEQRNAEIARKMEYVAKLERETEEMKAKNESMRNQESEISNKLEKLIEAEERLLRYSNELKSAKASNFDAKLAEKNLLELSQRIRHQLSKDFNVIMNKNVDIVQSINASSMSQVGKLATEALIGLLKEELRYERSTKAGSSYEKQNRNDESETTASASFNSEEIANLCLGMVMAKVDNIYEQIPPQGMAALLDTARSLLTKMESQDQATDDIEKGVIEGREIYVEGVESALSTYKQGKITKSGVSMKLEIESELDFASKTAILMRNCGEQLIANQRKMTDMQRQHSQLEMALLKIVIQVLQLLLNLTPQNLAHGRR